MANTPKRSKSKPNPEPKHDTTESRKVHGEVGISGSVEVEAHFPPALIDEYKASNKAEEGRENKRFTLEAATFAFVVIVAVLSLIQSCQSVRMSNAAQEANRITREDFRADQRPYLAPAFTGTPSEMMIVPSGPHIGELRITIHLANYGKSPAISTYRFLHTYVGDAQIPRIGVNEVPDRGEYVIPAGDHPTLYAYSDKLTDEQIKVIGANIAAIPMPVVVSGRIGYTDIFPEPKVCYETGICGVYVGTQYNSDDESAVCNGRQYVR